MRKVLVLPMLAALVIPAVAEKRPEKKERGSNSSISVLDSTEAQWGRRSINDSIYRGYTVNQVYLERGRQKLPDSFNMYKPTPIGAESVVKSSDKVPVTIRVNGKEQKLPTE